MNSAIVRKSAAGMTAAAALAAILLGLGTPSVSRAHGSGAGELIKSPSYASVYYHSTDGKRYVFPHDRVYKTWFADFSEVHEVTDDELYAIPLGGNVTYRPGVKMIKITTDPKVYAVDRGGVLRWVTSEEVAKEIYGEGWAKLVEDIADAYFVNYTVGAPITAAGDFFPSMLRELVPNIAANRAGVGAVVESLPIQWSPEASGSSTAGTGAASAPAAQADTTPAKFTQGPTPIFEHVKQRHLSAPPREWRTEFKKDGSVWRHPVVDKWDLGYALLKGVEWKADEVATIYWPPNSTGEWRGLCPDLPAVYPADGMMGYGCSLIIADMAGNKTTGKFTFRFKGFISPNDGGVGGYLIPEEQSYMISGPTP